MPMQLRPEARPAEWKHLDETQQTAFVSVVKAIGEAIERLPLRAAQTRTLRDPASWLTADRTSRTLFISGGRGSGKTTLLASMIQTTLKESTQTVDSKDQEFLHCLNAMRERVVWLEPIDMEPMPPTANLLSAILARVDDSVRRFGMSERLTPETEPDYGPRGLLGAGFEYRDALLQLQRLQTDGCLAWESNLSARKGQLDPDSYAVEAARTERARLSISSRFEAVLDSLAEQGFRDVGIRSPLFLLPVDDVDLNPLACLDLLKLLRLISVRRLFTVLLGDVKVADLVLNLKLSNDLAQVFSKVRQTDLLAMQPIAVATMAGDIAANALRKLLPSSQRIELKPMLLVEALNFRPLGYAESDQRLHELLHCCPLQPAEPISFLGKTVSLRDFVLVRDFATVETGPPVMPARGQLELDHLKRNAYSGLPFFKTTPRRLADSWLALQRIVGSLSPQNEESDRQVSEPSIKQLNWAHEEVVRHFAQLAQSSLAGDPALLPQERAVAARGIVQTPKGDWQMRSLPIRVSSDKEDCPPIELPGTTKSAPGYDVRFIPKAHTGWRFDVEEVFHSETKEPEKPTVRRMLSSSTATELTIFHDLLALGHGDAQFSSPLLRQASTPRDEWMTCEWRLEVGQSALLPWPAPPFSSFWEYDLFLSSWNDAVRETHVTDWEKFLQRLLFVWLNMGTAILDRGRPETLAQGRLPQWDKVSSRLATLVRRAGDSHDRRSAVFTDWLNKVILLLMPESGLPQGLTRPFFKNDHLVRFWRKQRQTITRDRAVRLAELVKLEMVELADRLLKIPVLEGSFKPSKQLIDKFVGSSVSPEDLRKIESIMRSVALSTSGHPKPTVRAKPRRQSSRK
jgi:hypothetical protein